MNTHDALLNAALQVLEEEGEAQFTTRSVCAIAKVTAPTLYHHFGSADGLLSAAIKEAFAQFLRVKGLLRNPSIRLWHYAKAGTITCASLRLVHGSTG